MSSVSPPASSPDPAALGMPLLVGLPVLIVIFAAIAILLLLLLALTLRVKRLRKYRAVPTDDPTKSPSSPFPPKVRLSDPPVPSMNIHMATQLSQLGARYPFAPHKLPSDSSPQHSRQKRPPRLRTKRKGNHKHLRGKHGVGKGMELSASSDSMDSLLDTPKEKEERSSSLASLGLGYALSPHLYMVPADKRWSRREAEEEVEEEDRGPDISLFLFYSEDDQQLVVQIERVSCLPLREDGAEVDAYVRLYLIPKSHELPQRRTSRTRTFRRDSGPMTDEKIRYEAMSHDELINSALHVEVLDFRPQGKHQVLGQTDLPLGQVHFQSGQASLSLQLELPQVRENLGTVLISISYNPESQKLSIIVLRAKDLNRGEAKAMDPQVKVRVAVGDKVLGKLKTKRKSQSSSPIFNEALTCSIDPAAVRLVTVCVAMLNDSRLASHREVGQVILGMQASGEEFRHWSDVLATPGKHIAEWHALQ